MKTEDINEKFDGFIHKLDGACGRLLVASMKDATVRQAMEMVTEVSLGLGELINQIESDE